MKISYRYRNKVVFGSILFLLIFTTCQVYAQSSLHYLDTLKYELSRSWPNNRTINFVFHGHSVPSGYFKTPNVHTLESYPFRLLGFIRDRYPTAVVNSIVTAIGGENSAQGVLRMDSEVLPHRPDVLFIDYGLNDRGLPYEISQESLRSMIESALQRNIRVVLLTPSPDLSTNWVDPEGSLSQQRCLINSLAQEYQVGLVDVYGLFFALLQRGEDIRVYMAQNNHPNALGHQLIAAARWSSLFEMPEH